MYPDQYTDDTRAKRIIKRHAKLLNNVTDNTLLWNYPTRSFHDFISNIGTITSYSYAIKICKEVIRVHIDVQFNNDNKKFKLLHTIIYQISN